MTPRFGKCYFDFGSAMRLVKVVNPISPSFLPSCLRLKIVWENEKVRTCLSVSVTLWKGQGGPASIIPAL
jgi:hypothetical protein